MNYKNACISSKGALVVLAASIILSTIIIISGGLSIYLIDHYSYVLFAVVGLHYLFYPFLGLLGEKWVRYKVLLVGIFVGFFINIVTLVTLYFVQLNRITVVGICTVLSFPYFLDRVYLKLL